MVFSASITITSRPCAGQFACDGQPDDSRSDDDRIHVHCLPSCYFPLLGMERHQPRDQDRGKKLPADRFQIAHAARDRVDRNHVAIADRGQGREAEIDHVGAEARSVLEDGRLSKASGNRRADEQIKRVEQQSDQHVEQNGADDPVNRHAAFGQHGAGHHEAEGERKRQPQARDEIDMRMQCVVTFTKQHQQEVQGDRDARWEPARRRWRRGHKSLRPSPPPRLRPAA